MAKKEAHNSSKIEKSKKIEKDENIAEKKKNSIIEKKHIKKRIFRRNNFKQFELQKLPDYIRKIFED